MMVYKTEILEESEITESQYWSDTHDGASIFENRMSALQRIIGGIAWYRLGLELGSQEKNRHTMLDKEAAIEILGYPVDQENIDGHPLWPQELPKKVFALVNYTMINQMSLVAQMQWDNLRIELGYITQVNGHTSRGRKLEDGPDLKGTWISRLLGGAVDVTLIKKHPLWPKTPPGSHGRAYTRELEMIEENAQILWEILRVEFGFISQVKMATTAKSKKRAKVVADDDDEDVTVGTEL